MAKVKYCVTEFTPNENQVGMSHSWSAKCVINNDIDADTLADRVQKRCGVREFEVRSVMAAIAEVIQEEVLESNRVSICNSKGEKVLSVYPRVSGSISDKDVQANQEKYPGKTVATEDMLTIDKITFSLGATVGKKFIKKFAMDKQAQKVKGSNLTVIDDDGEAGQTETNTSSGGGETIPGGGETIPGGNG